MKKVVLHSRISPEIKHKLALRAASEKRSESQVNEMALEAYLDHPNNETEGKKK